MAFTRKDTKKQPLLNTEQFQQEAKQVHAQLSSGQRAIASASEAWDRVSSLRRGLTSLSDDLRKSRDHWSTFSVSQETVTNLNNVVIKLRDINAALSELKSEVVATRRQVQAHDNKQEQGTRRHRGESSKGAASAAAVVSQPPKVASLQTQPVSFPVMQSRWDLSQGPHVLSSVARKKDAAFIADAAVMKPVTGRGDESAAVPAGPQATVEGPHSNGGGHTMHRKSTMAGTSLNSTPPSHCNATASGAVSSATTAPLIPGSINIENITFVTNNNFKYNLPPYYENREAAVSAVRGMDVIFVTTCLLWMNLSGPVLERLPRLFGF
jgi:hypothetical protein